MKIVNSIVVLLLSVIAVGIFTIPRFNYDTLVSRLTKLETRLNTTQDQFSRFDLLSQSKNSRVHSLLGWIEQAPGAFRGLQEGLDKTSGQVSDLSARLSDALARIETLEKRLGGGPGSTTVGSQDTLGQGGGYTDPLPLPEEMAKKAKKISPAKASELNEHEIVHELGSLGLLGDGPPALTLEGRQRVQLALERFKLSYKLIQAEENFMVQDLVDEKTRTGDFLELPVGPGPLEEDVPDFAGITHTKVLDEAGKKRVFYFPVEEYPEIEHLNDLRGNARDHLVRDAVALISSLPKG